MTTTPTSPAAPLIKQIRQALTSRQLADSGDAIVVGVSGGPDSMAMLHLLALSGLDLHLTGCYVDHGLRPDEIPAEIDLAGSQCALLGVPFEVKQIDVDHYCRSKKLSTETGARILRYRALRELKDQVGADRIAVGHTADDQAEELLIRLLRGSGRGGLAAMQHKNNDIIRPLLDIRKERLLAFLEKEQISFVNDSSNLAPVFLRNRIRLQLLPFLAEHFNPSISDTLLQTVNILREEDSLLSELSESAYGRCVTPDHQKKLLNLDRASFLELHPALQRRVLERLLLEMNTVPAFKTIEQLRRLTKKIENQGECHLPDGLRATRTYHGLEFATAEKTDNLRGSKATQSASVFLEINREGIFELPEIKVRLEIKKVRDAAGTSGESTLFLDWNQIEFPLLLRSVADGDRFHPAGSPGSKKINRFFTDCKIPRQERSSYPLLCMGDKVIAIIGLRADQHFVPTEPDAPLLMVRRQVLP
ncbi:MAG: tRNA lysidine(34) synthetase TilS [Thermodesulfobacteriota bacterium]